MTDMLNDALDTLRKHGVEPVIIQSKHIRLHWTWGGKSVHFTVPRSPSDWRSPLNSHAQLLRLLGKRRKQHTVAAESVAPVVLPAR